MSNNRTHRANNLGEANAQTALGGFRPFARGRMPARYEDGKGGSSAMDRAGGNVTLVAINVHLSASSGQQPGSVQKAKTDFHGLFNQAQGGTIFDRNDRSRLNDLAAKHREGLTNEADRTAFDNVMQAFNDSWGGKKFASEDWARFNAKLAGLRDVAPAPVAPTPAPAPAPVAAQPAPTTAVKETPAELTHEFFDNKYAYLYEGDVARMNAVRKDLNDMYT